MIFGPDYWSVVWSAPIHCVTKYCVIACWTIGNKFHWKQISMRFESNYNNFIQENEFYHIACQTVVFLSPPQCGKTWLQVLKHIFLCAAYMRHWIRPALVRVMACRLFGSKPLSKQMLGYCHLDHKEHTSVNFPSKYKIFRSWKCIWISRSPPSMTCAVWDINLDIPIRIASLVTLKICKDVYKHIPNIRLTVYGAFVVYQTYYQWFNRPNLLLNVRWMEWLTGTITFAVELDSRSGQSY